MSYDPRRDYYKTLRVQPDATADALRRAHRKRARAVHPDLHPEDPKADEKAQRINEAWNTLGDPARRRAYDAARAAFFGAKPPQAPMPSRRSRVRTSKRSDVRTSARQRRSPSSAVEAADVPAEDVGARPSILTFSLEQAARTADPLAKAAWILGGLWMESWFNTSKKRR